MRRRLPSETDKAMRLDRNGYTKTAKQIKEAVEKETRRRWRAMLIKVKSRLEDAFSEEHVSPEEKSEAFYDNFALDMVTPDGLTVRQYVIPDIEAMKQVGAMSRNGNGVRLLEGAR